jgi:hypothetical protein
MLSLLGSSDLITTPASMQTARRDFTVGKIRTAKDKKIPLRDLPVRYCNTNGVATGL